MSRYTPLGSASGGIGSVLFCHDGNLDRKVAVKFVNPGEHRRLLDELAALQRIRSKHVVEVFDVAYFNRVQMGIVEEFVDGKELTHFLKIPPNDDYLRLVYQMAVGLADIHAVGIIHRDIKPPNMLLDGAGILKIIDFNLARPVDDALTRGFVGTRGFAAPELYGTGRVTFDAKIDIYALGVTAYVLLAGLPLPDLLNAQPPEPGRWKQRGGGFHGLNLPFDTQLVVMLDRCFEVDPAARPSAGELASLVTKLRLRGQHRALFSTEAGQTLELNEAARRVLLQASQAHQVVIQYDGLEFTAQSVTGDVWANNIRVNVGTVFPHCCVIALGDPTSRGRTYITMDQSHPEVVL